MCANCHEGECSGRLSFNSGASAAANHVRRYLDNVSEKQLDALYAVLRFTKEHCHVYPVKATDIWDWNRRQDALIRWRNPDNDRYFIPLGALKLGTYELRMTMAEDVQGQWRVIDEDFEIVAEEKFCRGQSLRGKFEAGNKSYYLHLQSRSALIDLQLDPVPEK